MPTANRGNETEAFHKRLQLFTHKRIQIIHDLLVRVMFNMFKGKGYKRIEKACLLPS